MPTPTKAVKANPVSGALIDPPVATFCSANGIAQLSDLATFYDFKGGINCSANPNYPAASSADVYIVSVAGKIGGASGVVVEVGDQIIAISTNAGGTQAAVGSSWVVTQNNINPANVAFTGGTITGTTISGLTISTTTGTLTIGNLVPVEFQQQFQTIGTFYAGGNVYISDALTTAGDVIFSGAYDATFTLTANTAVTFPASGTLATTTGNVATATALATARNVFNISFDGTANVAGDATNTGHFASVPGTGAAGHFVTENGTAPTVIAGRSAWYSDGSGLPSFKNGIGAPVTLVRSSDIGVSVQAYDADLTTWAGITPGAGVATALAVANNSAGGYSPIDGTATLSNKTLTEPKFASGGFIADANGNQLLIFTTTASAVNEVTLANAATAGSPALSATGGDTNISINLVPKGTGGVMLPDGAAATPALRFAADTNTGIYRIGADNIGFATAGTLRWHISGGGNLFSGSGNYDYNIGASLFLGSSGSAAAPTFSFGSSTDTNTGMYRVSEDQIGFTAGGTLRATINTTDLILTVGLTLPKTITAGGTTGAQTINKTSGSVNFAAAATSLVVTNSLCTTSSVIHCTIATNDATAANVKAVAAAGSFTIYLSTAPTAETRVNFLLTN